MEGNTYWIILTTCYRQNKEPFFYGDINPTEITPVDKFKKYICRSNVFHKTYPTGNFLSTVFRAILKSYETMPQKPKSIYYD